MGGADNVDDSGVLTRDSVFEDVEVMLVEEDAVLFATEVVTLMLESVRDIDALSICEVGEASTFVEVELLAMVALLATLCVDATYPEPTRK